MKLRLLATLKHGKCSELSKFKMFCYYHLTKIVGAFFSLIRV